MYHESLSKADYGWLILCAAGQVLVFAGYPGTLLWTVRADDGPQVPVGMSVRVVLASFAATQVFAFGGVGGLAVLYWVLRRFEYDGDAAAIRLIGLNTAVYLVFGAIGWSAAAAALVTTAAPLGMTVPWLVGIPMVLLAARWFTAPHRLQRWVVPRPGRRSLGRWPPVWVQPLRFVAD